MVRFMVVSSRLKIQNPPSSWLDGLTMFCDWLSGAMGFPVELEHPIAIIRRTAINNPIRYR
jgi:hypothetical protein